MYIIHIPNYVHSDIMNALEESLIKYFLMLNIQNKSWFIKQNTTSPIQQLLKCTQMAVAEIWFNYHYTWYCTRIYLFQCSAVDTYLKFSHSIEISFFSPSFITYLEALFCVKRFLTKECLRFDISLWFFSTETFWRENEVSCRQYSRRNLHRRVVFAFWNLSRDIV